jgi:CHAD domain-containing protein
MHLKNRVMRKPVSHSNKIFTEYFRESSTDLFTQTDLCRNALTKKNIHALRLSMKNFRAFCGLLDSAQPRRQVTTSFPATFETFFATLGTLRDLQVAEKSLAKASSELKISFRKTGTRLKKLQKNQAILVAEQLKNFNPGPGINRIGQKVDRLLARQKSPDSLGPLFSRFISETAADIASLAKLRHSERVIHAIRGKIKVLLYTTKVFGDEPWMKKDHARFRTALLDQIQMELGEWHDLVVIKELVTGLSPIRGKIRVKPWKVYILEEYFHRKQSLLLKQINLVLKSDLFVSQDPVP